MNTPARIEKFLTENTHRMDLGIQFRGDEPNAARRDWNTATARWCLMASWPYEAAAGNQSIPAVYKAIHDHDKNFLCDRFYLPATPGDMRLLEKNNIPIFGIESKQPITEFDVVATSISYPVLSMSFIKMLTMSGIAARWRDREPNTNPMLMVGGLSYGAPEVLAPVVDCWFLGEAEDEPGNPGIGCVTARIAAFKTQGRWHTDRLGCYEDLAREFNFLYFPRFVKVHYQNEDRAHVGVGPHLSKQVTAYTSLLDGMRMPFRKRHVRDLDAIAPLDNPPLLYADPAMGSGDVEVARGCVAWCTFCALSLRQKPYREHSVPYLVKHAKGMQDNMGSTRMAPFSPDLPMYTRKRQLASELLENVSDEIDAPSMRVDDFNADHTFILLQVHGGMDSVSLGVEGNSARMRDLLGKGTSDADVKEAVAKGIRAGIRKFKLYMISNLPGEDEGDVYRILKLARDLADIRDSMNQPNVRIQFSWTPLIIEANTPLQWFAPQPASRVLGDVWEEFRDLKIDSKLGAKSEPNKIAFFQLCQRASRDVGEALVDTILEFDQACWGGVPRTFENTLKNKLVEHGFLNGFADCFDERYLHDMFGWEFIDTGVNPQLLWQTYVQMREFVEYTDSHSYDLNFDSSYRGSEWIARCLAAGTRIRLADGSTAPIEDLVGTHPEVLTLDGETGSTVSAVAPHVWNAGTRHRLVEVEFEDGSTLRCTPDHKLLLEDGAFLEAQHLVEGDEVATIQDSPGPGWLKIEESFWHLVEVGEQPSRWGSATGVVHDGSPCMNWVGSLDPDGYGVFRVRSLGLVAAYAFSWISSHGPIPDGMVLNHICHNKRCVRHLELCTVGQNTAQAWRSQPLCRAGKHPNDEENWNWVNGRPRCRLCVNAAAEAYQERKAQMDGRTRWKSGQATCRNGHEYTEENTYWYVRKKNGRPARSCRSCAREYEKWRRSRPKVDHPTGTGD